MWYQPVLNATKNVLRWLSLELGAKKYIILITNIEVQTYVCVCVCLCSYIHVLWREV